MRRSIEIVCAAAFAALLAACSDPRVALHAFPGPPEATLTDDAVSLRAGTAWVFEAAPEDESDKVVSATASGSVQVLPTGERNLFVVVGAAPGEGSVTFTIGGRAAKTLHARVAAQPL